MTILLPRARLSFLFTEKRSNAPNGNISTTRYRIVSRNKVPHCLTSRWTFVEGSSADTLLNRRRSERRGESASQSASLRAAQRKHFSIGGLQTGGDERLRTHPTALLWELLTRASRCNCNMYSANISQPLRDPKDSPPQGLYRSHSTRSGFQILRSPGRCTQRTHSSR